MSFRRRIMNSNKEFTLSSNNDSVSPASGTQLIYVYLGDELIKDNSLIVNNITGQVTSASYDYQTGKVSIKYKSNTSTSSFKYGSADITYRGLTKTYSFTQAKDYVTGTYNDVIEVNSVGSDLVGYIGEMNWSTKHQYNELIINNYTGTVTVCNSVSITGYMNYGYCVKQKITSYASGNSSKGSMELMSESEYKEVDYDTYWRAHLKLLPVYISNGPYNFNNNILNLTGSSYETFAGKKLSFNYSLTLNSRNNTYSLTYSNLSYGGTILFGSLPGSKTSSGTWSPSS